MLAYGTSLPSSILDVCVLCRAEDVGTKTKVRNNENTEGVRDVIARLKN